MAVSHLHSNISASWRTDASVKLSSVAASLTSVSARAMLDALIGGESDPRVLADLAKGKMRRKIPALTEALNRYAGNDFAVAVVNNRTAEAFRFRAGSRYQTASVMKNNFLRPNRSVSQPKKIAPSTAPAK